MKKKLVYVCSPLRGDYERNELNARNYCRAIMEKFPDVIPIAPHVYFPRFLDDRIPEERALGMTAGLQLLDMCDEIWVFGLDKPSMGMQAEIVRAIENKLPIWDGRILLPEEAEK